MPLLCMITAWVFCSKSNNRSVFIVPYLFFPSAVMCMMVWKLSPAWELETWSTQNASPDCLTECKKRMPPCIAYSYNKNTTKCTTVTGCDLLLFKNTSMAITYYSSMITFLVLILNPFLNYFLCNCKSILLPILKWNKCSWFSF